MVKKLNIKMKQNSEEWIKKGNEKINIKDKQTFKRLTIDIPENLHKALKIECIEKGIKMSDFIRETIAKKLT